MIPRDLSSANKLGCMVLLLVLTNATLAQRRPANPLESFLDTQFWLGLRMGVNVTQAFPETRATGFSPINYNADSLEKQYDDFSLPGGFMGIEMNFYHRGFSLSFQPAYKRSRYSYSSMLSWTAESTSDRFETQYDVEQRLDMVELPLMFKYDLIRSGKIRPFVMAGGFYSIIASAQKEIDITQVDYSSGTPLRSDGGSSSLGVKDDFKNFSGVGGGVGVNLDYWNIRTVVELNYRRSLTEATKFNARQNELASIGEVNDEVFLRDINFSVSFVFPFRFIDQQFKAY